MKCWKAFFFHVSSFWLLAFLHNSDTFAESLGIQLGPAVSHSLPGPGFTLTDPWEGHSSSHHIPLPGSTQEGRRGTCPFPDLASCSHVIGQFGHMATPSLRRLGNVVLAAEVLFPVKRGEWAWDLPPPQRALAAWPSSLPTHPVSVSPALFCPHPTRPHPTGTGAIQPWPHPQVGTCCLCWLLCCSPAPHSLVGCLCGSFLILIQTTGTPGSQPLLPLLLPRGGEGEPRARCRYSHPAVTTAPTRPHSKPWRPLAPHAASLPAGPATVPWTPGPTPAGGSLGCPPYIQQCPFCPFATTCSMSLVTGPLHLGSWPELSPPASQGGTQDWCRVPRSPSWEL